MKRIILGLVLIAAFHTTAFATWSVIAVDAKTGQVIIASATCVRQEGFPAAQAERRARPDGRAGGDRARRRRGRLPGRRRQHAREPDAGLQRDEEGHAAGARSSRC